MIASSQVGVRDTGLNPASQDPPSLSVIALKHIRGAVSAGTLIA